MMRTAAFGRTLPGGIGLQTARVLTESRTQRRLRAERFEKALALAAEQTDDKLREVLKRSEDSGDLQVALACRTILFERGVTL